jgi:hypothetical protein
MNSCGDVLDIASGAVVQTQAGIATDEIWYNPGDERVYFGGFVSTPGPTNKCGTNWLKFVVIGVSDSGCLNFAPPTRPRGESRAPHYPPDA